MSNKEVWSEDWLEDSLVKTRGDSYKSRKLKNRCEEQSNRWSSFHFATRLKLDGADYFCRQALGAASMPDNLGLPLLAHRHLMWYFDAFFSQLVSAYDTLLQELNVVYAKDLALNPEQVRWDRIKGKIPNELAKYIEKEWENEWFWKIRRYRNVATHHYGVPLGSGAAGWGDKPLDYNEHQTFIHYMDNSGIFRDEEAQVCTEYLKKMVKFISRVWENISKEFV